MNYKDGYDHTSLLREFSESATTVEESAPALTDAQIETLLDFSFEDYAQTLEKIKNNFSEYGIKMDISPIDILSKFFAQNKLQFKRHNVSTKRFIELLEEYEIGQIFMHVLEEDVSNLSDCSDLNKCIESMINLFAILTSFSDNFYDFFSSNNLFSIAFNFFVNNDDKYADLSYSEPFNCNLLSIMINTAYMEIEGSDYFPPFIENSFEATNNFCFAFRSKISSTPKCEYLHEYGVRFFAEIAKITKQFHTSTFHELEITIIIDFFDGILNSRSYLYALQFASYMISQNVHMSDFLLPKFYELFRKRLFILSEDFDMNAFNELKKHKLMTQSAEIQFISLFFEFAPFKESQQLILDINLVNHIKRLLEVDTISQSVVQLLITMLEKRDEIHGYGKKNMISLFDTVLVAFDNDITNFIDFIQSNYDNMNIYGKYKSFNLLTNLLSYNDQTCNYIVTTYDFESVANLLDSGSTELSSPALQFLLYCVNESAKLSLRAVEDLVQKFDDYGIPDAVEELSQQIDDPKISSEAERLIDAVKFYIPDNDDEL